MPEVPAEMRQATKEMADVARGHLELAKRQSDRIDTWAPQILAQADAAGKQQLDLGAIAIQSANDTWARFKESKPAWDTLVADSAMFFDMDKTDAQGYVDKMFKKEVRASRGDRHDAIVDYRGSRDFTKDVGYLALKQEKPSKGDFAGVEVDGKIYKPGDTYTHPDTGIPLTVTETGLVGATGIQYFDNVDSGRFGKKIFEGGRTRKDINQALADYEEKYGKATNAEIKKIRDKYAEDETAITDKGENLMDQWGRTQKAMDRAEVHAKSSVNAAIADANQSNRIELERMGVKPGTSLYSTAINPSAVQTAGALSVAAQGARMSAKGGNVAAGSNVLNIGRGYPTDVSNFQRTGIAGLQGGAGQFAQGAGSLANMWSVPNQTAGVGMQGLKSGIEGMNNIYQADLGAVQGNNANTAALASAGIGAAGVGLGALAQSGALSAIIAAIAA
jgi:hypothetical protein